jgi:hypothetical protein
LNKTGNENKFCFIKLIVVYLFIISLKQNQMRNLFTRECFNIQVFTQDEKIRVYINSDYSGSNRKSQLYVNEERLQQEVESFWKDTKTKKLNQMLVSFDEIDWYDDEVDVYETPSVSMKRGDRKSKVSHHRHGSVPKEWGVDLRMLFEKTTKKPILDTIKPITDKFLSTKDMKVLEKGMTQVLQGKTTRYTFELQNEYQH